MQHSHFGLGHERPVGELNDVPNAANPHMSRVAILQPSYLPWKGFFHMVHDVDVFVHLDDVQFTESDWRTRNRIKLPDGRTTWLSVPVLGGIHQLLCDVRIDDSQRWRRKHVEALRHSYAGAPYFRPYFSAIETILASGHDRLTELDIALTERIASWLGLGPRWVRSSELRAEGTKTERLIHIVGAVGGTSLLVGPAARAYLDEGALADVGVELRWQDYSGYPEYPQVGTDFDHFVTVLDLLFSVGPTAPKYIWDH